MRRAIAALMTCLLASCQTLSSAADVEARLAPDDQDARDQIAGALTAHFGRQVIVADTAFVASSVFALAHSAGTSPDAKAAGGRVLDAPKSVQLVMRRGRCMLVDLATHEAIELDGVNCIAAKP